MQKTVLIITSKSEKIVAWKERQQYIEEFCQNVEGLLKDTWRILYTTFDDLHYFKFVCGNHLVNEKRGTLCK